MTRFSTSDLFEAAADGDVNKVKMCLEQIPVNTVGDYKHELGYTALHVASLEGQLEVAEILLNKGADPDFRGYGGFTPLHTATVRSYGSRKTEIARLLLSNHANVRAREDAGRTPLWFAAASENIELVELLISAGSNVNLGNTSGVTPVFWAVWKNDLKMLKLLLEHGANPSVKDNEGRTPMSCANDKGYNEVIEVLRKSHKWWQFWR